MKITILGAGALGGYFGGWLAEAGADVTFLVRPKRAELLRRDGLVIESPVAPLRRAVKIATRETITPDADLVLLTCKAYDLADAIETIRPALAPDGAVLPIQNGMKHIETLTEAFGPGRVIGGLCKIQATLAPDGRIQHMNDWREIVFGELDGRMSERVTRLAAMFPSPQTLPRAVPNIREELWKKLVHLGTVAALTTLTRDALGPLMRTSGGMGLVEETLRTTARIAAAEGVPMTEAFLQSYLDLFRNAGNAYKASMLRDMEKDGQTEGAHILSWLRDRAAAHGIDAPIFRIAAANVEVYEFARAARAM